MYMMDVDQLLRVPDRPSLCTYVLVPCHSLYLLISTPCSATDALLFGL